ncbi:uncharacterized protein LOC132559149 [Ylistrum balloti]|uniref:uncharacterized protein LOC132559149 n=1 Tax=Ylistrum balloti TaxID=509963 RepID=UPI002905D054|nr:uncharacterized protein LOC132559149 [Ylistrum balloti]
MEKGMVGDICAVTSTVFAGMFAGGALGSNVFTMPALMKIKDTSAMRTGWKHHFLDGSRYMPRLALASIVAGSIACYLDDTDNKYYWLAGAGTMFSLIPYTMFVIIPDVNILLKDDVIEQRGEEWVRTNVDKWGKRHLVRSAVSSAAFGTYLFALLRRKSYF